MANISHRASENVYAYSFWFSFLKSLFCFSITEVISVRTVSSQKSSLFWNILEYFSLEWLVTCISLSRTDGDHCTCLKALAVTEQCLHSIKASSVSLALNRLGCCRREELGRGHRQDS